jgi:hypothetical protein
MRRRSSPSSSSHHSTVAEDFAWILRAYERPGFSEKTRREAGLLPSVGRPLQCERDEPLFCTVNLHRATALISAPVGGRTPE